MGPMMPGGGGAPGMGMGGGMMGGDQGPPGGLIAALGAMGGLPGQGMGQAPPAAMPGLASGFPADPGGGPQQNALLQLLAALIGQQVPGSQGGASPLGMAQPDVSPGGMLAQGGAYGAPGGAGIGPDMGGMGTNAFGM